MIALGLDIGSSSIKGAIFDTEKGCTLAHATSPPTEMPISSPVPGYAEQDPNSWWSCVLSAAAMLRQQAPVPFQSVGAIGISYQMHGLVLIDKAGSTVMPSIIWCDSRAAAIGRRAFDSLGHEWCLKHLLNSPGNFTASKLRWVRENAPDIYERIHKFLLPGDYVAYRMTGTMSTTLPGLSEGMFWDFPDGAPSEALLQVYGIDKDLVPPLVPTFGTQGTLAHDAAVSLGLPVGVPVTYRAGDQPNNALSLNVLEPGEIAATAGTSGVVFAVSNMMNVDPASRINAFAHVNHRTNDPRIGILLCINGTGIANSWARGITGLRETSYEDLNSMAGGSPAGANGLTILPFGNGTERLFEDRLVGAHILHIDFARHQAPDILRAVQEGVAFSLARGLRLMTTFGITPAVIRAGKANMFLSPLFREALATTTGVPIELFKTEGAEGAARGAAFGAGAYRSLREAGTCLERLMTVDPSSMLANPYMEAFARWNHALDSFLNKRE